MKETMGSVTRELGCMILTAVLLALSGQVQAKDVNLWSYYKFGPFVTEYQGANIKQGLVLDLARLLDKRSYGLYTFIPKVIPRKRLDRYIVDGTPAVVVFVNPSWMQDNVKTKYYWTAAILRDKNEIVSRMFGQDPKRIRFNDVNSFKGMTFGSVFGRRIRGVDELVKRGEIKRIDVAGEDQNLKKLLAGRIDLMTAPNSMLRFLIKNMSLEGQIYFSPKPLFSYTRHFMVTKNMRDVYQFMDQFTKYADTDKEWLEIRKKYGL